MSSTPIHSVPARDVVGCATLDLFAEAEPYNRLLWDSLNSLGPVSGEVLEVGCGIGNLSRLILEDERVTHLHGIDPDPSYIDRFVANADRERASASVAGIEDFRKPRFRVAVDGSFDAIVCSNVLEHIDDDVAALRDFARLLRPSGVALVLVPAHPALFSTLDRALSHRRRYRGCDLRRAALEGGLEIVRIRHFNPLAALGWWWNGRVLRREQLPAGQVRAYSRWGLGLSRCLDAWNPFPVGVSLIAALRRLDVRP
jgi:SAM-dependent methyltransferase